MIALAPLLKIILLLLPKSTFPAPPQGISCLFHGVPGTGKTMAAECLGFEMGKPIKFVNCAELVNKYVGETGKNIEKVSA